MDNPFKTFRRKIYVEGGRMIATPIMSYSSWSLPLSAIGASIVGVLLQNWHYSTFPPIGTIVGQIIFFGICAGFAAFVIMIIFKTFVSFLGCVMKLIGESDKITLEKSNNGKTILIKIQSDEEEKFSGEFKILKINDEILITPLTMGIVRGKTLDRQIIIPKGESVGIGVGFFDEDLGYAYFIDVHEQKRFLPDQTRVFTKLSGNLDSGEEIIKEKEWFVRYTDDNGVKGLSLGNLLEIKKFHLGAGKLKMGFTLTSIVKK